MACSFTKITFSLTYLFVVFVLLIQIDCIHCRKEKKENAEASEKWKKKNIQDYNDADVERLFDQWEDADEDELEEDELPEWKRKPPAMDMSQLDMSDPEGILMKSKKGRTLMLFATVSGNPTQDETDKITQIWRSNLFNANYELQLYPVSESRVIFMLKDGAIAWEVKDYLVQQDRCEDVSIEGKSYPGKGAKPDAESKDTDSKNTDSKKSKSNKSDKDNRTGAKKAKTKTEL